MPCTNRPNSQCVRFQTDKLDKEKRIIHNNFLQYNFRRRSEYAHHTKSVLFSFCFFFHSFRICMFSFCYGFVCRKAKYLLFIFFHFMFCYYFVFRVMLKMYGLEWMGSDGLFLAQNSTKILNISHFSYSPWMVGCWMWVNEWIQSICCCCFQLQFGFLSFHFGNKCHSHSFHSQDKNNPENRMFIL